MVVVVTGVKLLHGKKEPCNPTHQAKVKKLLHNGRVSSCGFLTIPTLSFMLELLSSSHVKNHV
jgi:hypothetical protein